MIYSDEAVEKIYEKPKKHKSKLEHGNSKTFPNVPGHSSGLTREQRKIYPNEKLNKNVKTEQTAQEHLQEILFTDYVGWPW